MKKIILASGSPRRKGLLQILIGDNFEKIDGCYFNIVGLPLYKLNKLLKMAGVDIFKI